MNIEPLPKGIYNKAKEHGVNQIILRFSGGNDEGYLDIDTDPLNTDLHSEIEDWAWSVYNYSGAGDGSDYGDTITYDLEKGEVTTEEWYHVIQSEKGGIKKLAIANDEENKE